MQVLDFNTQKGIYSFEISNIDTTLHAHPAAEFILAEEGEFSLEIEGKRKDKLVFAVIGKNITHQLDAKNSSLKITMIEYHDETLKSLLNNAGISLKNGLYLSEKASYQQFSMNDLIEGLSDVKMWIGYDERTRKAIEYINNSDGDYNQLITALKKVTYLSESRLSHLFKENMGISIKKFALWARLRTAIQIHLNYNEDLLTSLLRSGFYDQPHFSRAFKNMLGIRPSSVYNSRTIQA